MGNSMGGAVALAASLLYDGIVDGLILFAPMILVKSRPPDWQFPLLLALAALAPAWALLGSGSSDSNRAQYRDAAVLEVVERDTLAYKGKMRLGTATALLGLCQFVVRRAAPRRRARMRCVRPPAAAGGRRRRQEGELGNVRCPFLSMHGDADTIVDVESSRRLHASAVGVADRTLRIWPGALHALAGELPETRELMLQELLAWVEAHAGGGWKSSPPAPALSSARQTHVM